MALSVIGKLAIRISMVNEQPHSPTFATHGVFNHLHVGIGISKGQIVLGIIKCFYKFFRP